MTITLLKYSLVSVSTIGIVQRMTCVEGSRAWMNVKYVGGRGVSVVSTDCSFGYKDRVLATFYDYTIEPEKNTIRPKHTSAMDIIKFFEVRTGYTFKDQSLPQEAILAAGASSQRKDVEGDPRGNKRLALIGDALLRLEIVDQWHATGVPPCMTNCTSTLGQYSQNLGQTQKIVSRRASNKNLEKIGREAGLAKYIITHPGQKHAGRTTIASAVEALVGAAWLDSNNDFATVRGIVRALSIDPTSR